MGQPDEQSDGTESDAGEQSLDPAIAKLQLEVSEESATDDGEDFTLATLSQAYAEVVRGENEDEDESDGEDVFDGAPDDMEDETSSADAVEEDDDAACPISPESIVESILFVGSPSDVKLTGRKIASVLRDVAPKEVAQIVQKLNARYAAEDSAWRISTEGGNYQMVLEESLESFKDEYFGRNREFKLNQSAIDVLAVVAYHQPATAQQIDKIRGKNSGSVLSQLVKRKLLIREPTEGSPAQKEYRTTDRFLDLFGLAEIEDLPQSHEVADIEDLVD